MLLVKRGQLSTFFADYDSNYKSRLIALDLLPLMAEFESNDIMLCVKSLSLQELTFILTHFCGFVSHHTHLKMSHTRS